MIVVVLLLALIIAPTAAAQNAGEVAALGCKNAVARKVRAEVPGADSVRLSPGPQVQSSGRTTTVQGSGQYLDRATREWRTFTYDCSYSASSGKVRVTLQVSGAPRETRR
ncbi:MAG: hypothetical protein ACRENU_00690 [Gemmatimonadaceae bacterium]